MKRTIEFSQNMAHIHTVTVEVDDNSTLKTAIDAVNGQGSVTDVISALNDIVGVRVIAVHREVDTWYEPTEYNDDYKFEEVM